MFQARQLSADAEEAISATVTAAKSDFVEVMGLLPFFLSSNRPKGVVWRMKVAKLPASSQSRNHCCTHKDTSIQVVSTIRLKHVTALTSMVTGSLILTEKALLKYVRSMAF
jgi:hypothetical protein